MASCVQRKPLECLWLRCLDEGLHLLASKAAVGILAGRGVTGWQRPDPASGWSRLYVDHVTQADEGADLDFLVGRRGAEVGRESH